MPRVAQNWMFQISDISAVISEDTFERPIYAGNCIARYKTDSVKVITVRTTGFDACEATGGSASISAIDNDTDAGVHHLLKKKC